MKTVLVVFVVGALSVLALQQPPEEGWRLLEFGDGSRQWFPPTMVDSLVFKLSNPQHHGIPFMDVTDHQEIVPFNQSEPLNYPTSPNYRQQVNQLISNIDPARPRAWLQVLTDYQNRYRTSTYGRDSALYIARELQSIAQSNNRNDIQVETFSHSFIQPSVIATIPGTDLASEIVIIGAHEDSIASGMPNGRAPGADDDGSGTVVVMEAFKVLVDAGFRPRRTVEFHTYAGEEGGLLGSADIARSYNNNNRNVHGMLQFDMNGCCSASSGLTRGTLYNVCLDNSFTDSALTSFLQMAISEFGTMNQGTFRYGYAASDHASWARNGYPAAHVKENVNYPPIHTANDNFSNIDFDYLSRFVNIALAFVVELGEM